MATSMPGALTAVTIYILAILVFTARLLHRSRLGLQIGILLELMVLPILFLLWKGIQNRQPVLYFIQAGLMLIFLLVEYLLDYAWKIDFRQKRMVVIAYVVLFFAGTGGMLGIAAHAGPAWTAASALLFLIMAALAFIQRSRTGL